jgi:hypothetical protein
MSKFTANEEVIISTGEGTIHGIVKGFTSMSGVELYAVEIDLTKSPAFEDYDFPVSILPGMCLRSANTPDNVIEVDLKNPPV